MEIVLSPKALEHIEYWKKQAIPPYKTELFCLKMLASKTRSRASVNPNPSNINLQAYGQGALIGRTVSFTPFKTIRSLSYPLKGITDFLAAGEDTCRAVRDL